MSNRSSREDRVNEHIDGWAEALSAMKRDAANLDEKQITELLAHVVEGEIIPRLMMAHQNSVATSADGNLESAVSPEAIERFAQLTISGGVDDLEDHIVSLTRQGIVIETVFLDLMAPAARKLGEYWEQDVCSFTDVTIGLGQLQTLLFRLSERHKRAADTDAVVPKGVFVTPPGSQHSFGIRMVEDLFRRAGWKTICEPAMGLQDLIVLVQTEHIDLVGIGLIVEEQLKPTQEMIVQVRQSSRNAAVKIMVGGKLIVEQPELVDPLGADFSVLDAREAVTIAQNIIYNRATRH